METIQIRACLRVAIRQDIFNDQIPIANKQLFLKDPVSQEFYGTYVIPQLTIGFASYYTPYSEKAWRDSDNYTIVELLNGLHSKQFYVLEQTNSSSHFNFILNLRSAVEYDFFDGPTSVKTNTIYYVKAGDEMQGPHVMGNTAQFEYLRNAIQNGTLFVPSAQQTFQPYKVPAA